MTQLLIIFNPLDLSSDHQAGNYSSNFYIISKFLKSRESSVQTSTLQRFACFTFFAVFTFKQF